MWLYLIWDLVKTLQEMICTEQFTLPSTSFAERLQSDLSSPCRNVYLFIYLFIIFPQ